MTRRYLVAWLIDVWAETPQEAAEQADQARRRPGSIATVYTVLDRSTGKKIDVDLLERKEAGE